MQDTLSQKLLATLRRVSPSQVVAYAGDDDARQIAVPKRRRKWAQVISTIESLPWVRLEFLDGRGALLGTFDNTEPATDLEDLSGSRTQSSAELGLGPHEVQLSRVLLDVMLKAQQTVLTFRDKETATLLEGLGTCMREQTAAMTALAGIYRDQVKAASDVAQLRAEATARQEAGDGSLKELIEAAPQIAQLLPLLKGLLTAGSPPAARAPANGAQGTSNAKKE